MVPKLFAKIALALSLISGLCMVRAASLAPAKPVEAHVKQDPAHATNWSFIAPIKVPLPRVKDKSWVHNPIDAFVLARLEAEGMKPSPRADRVTLLRRLSLDLTGLPPTLTEVETFLADRSTNAYEKQVERLLASPHYGEQWGRHWLDVARYADSNGYEKDLPRSIWPYRDWVINAFNQNLPFDQFTIDQLAGDLLPNSTVDQKVATGFSRNSMINEEGGVDPEEFRIAAIINRVETTGKTWLGLTVNCAQCHSHKYDPISQREYYQLFSFLNNDDEPTLEVPNAAVRAQRADITSKIAALEKELLKNDGDVTNREAAWEAKPQNDLAEWQVLAPDDFYGSVGTKFNKLSDDSLLATASNPPRSVYTVSVKTKLMNITGFRLEVLTDPNLPQYGPGRAPNGNFVLTQFGVEMIGADGKTNAVALTNATADFSQPGFSITNVLAEKADNAKGWAIDGNPLERNMARKAVFETKTPVGLTQGSTLIFNLTQTFGKEHAIGRFRLSATTSKRPVIADPLSSELRSIASLKRSERTPEQQAKLFSYFITVDPKSKPIYDQIAALQKTWPIGDSTMVLLARDQPRDTHVFKRGDFRSPLEPVKPGVPAFLPPLPTNAPLNRLTFARWLVDRRNPLTARVTINRFWQEYFGRGLVVTSEDFGTQGDRPSHPALLDWLACEFMDRGWDVKAMQRLIVESATYQQSSKVTPDAYVKDQYNRWLGRGPRFRVDAEGIRDIALSASGLLSDKVGGPSVYPPIPDGVLSLAYGAPMKWETSTGADRYRRGLYIYWKRSVPYPSLSIFDAPNADVTCPRRVMSDTPLQALTTLNDAVFHEAAQAMAMRIWKEGGKVDRDRAIYAFRLCTGRAPDETELQQVLALVKDREEYFDDRTKAAAEVALPEPLPNPKDMPADLSLRKVAAWTIASRVLLNLDETITKE